MSDLQDQFLLSESRFIPVQILTFPRPLTHDVPRVADAVPAADLVCRRVVAVRFYVRLTLLLHAGQHLWEHGGWVRVSQLNRMTVEEGEGHKGEAVAEG